MKVIERMEEDRFEGICDAGADLLAMARKLVAERGLEEDDIIAVVSVAVAGAIKDFEMPITELFDGIDVGTKMWRKDHADQTAVFDPPHRRPEFEEAIAVSRTSTNQAN